VEGWARPSLRIRKKGVEREGKNLNKR